MVLQKSDEQGALDVGKNVGLRSRLAAHPSIRRLLRVLRLLVVVAVIGSVCYAVVRDWASVKDALRNVGFGSIALSLLAAVAALIGTVKVWRHILAALGSELHGSHAAQVYLTGQLARYLPGSVWAFLLQAQLGRRHEVPRVRSLLAVLLAVGIGSVTGLTISVVAIPALAEHWGRIAWLLALGPLALIALIPPVMTWIANLALRVLRRPRLDKPIAGRQIAMAAAWSLSAWLLFGVHILVLVRAVSGSSAGGYPLVTATFALAVCSGFVAFLLPSGVGVREAVIVAGLTTVMTGGAALAVALISRLLCTLADIVSAAGAGIASRITQRRTDQAEAAADEPAV